MLGSNQRPLPCECGSPYPVPLCLIPRLLTRFSACVKPLLAQCVPSCTDQVAVRLQHFSPSLPAWADALSCALPPLRGRFKTCQPPLMLLWKPPGQLGLPIRTI